MGCILKCSEELKQRTNTEIGPKNFFEMTSIKKILKAQDPYRPKPLMIPAGKGSILSRQFDRLIHSLKSKLPKAFEDTAYQEKSGLLHDGYQLWGPDQGNQ